MLCCSFLQGLLKSSVRKRRRSSSGRRQSGISGEDLVMIGSAGRTFVLKPVPSPSCRPLLVFVNPRSGGNQGARLMHKLQWLLNPRQVFDLTDNGPRAGCVCQRLHLLHVYITNDIPSSIRLSQTTDTLHNLKTHLSKSAFNDPWLLNPVPLLHLHLNYNCITYLLTYLCHMKVGTSIGEPHHCFLSHWLDQEKMKPVDVFPCFDTVDWATDWASGCNYPQSFFCRYPAKAEPSLE